MTPTIWTPDNALFLAGIALTIIFLVIGEIREARRTRATVRIVPARRRFRRSPFPRASAERLQAPAAPAPWQAQGPSPEAAEPWRTSRVPATAIRQSALD